MNLIPKTATLVRDYSMRGTEGTNQLTPCPHCGKMNNDVCHKQPPPLWQVSKYKHTCSSCQLPFVVYACWEIRTRAIKPNEDLA